MKINIDNIIIEIEPELLSIFHQPINVFSTDNLIVTTKISEYKNVIINLKISLENDIWNVPYLLQFKKNLKEVFLEKYSDTFIELSTNINDDDDDDDDDELNKYIPSKTDIFEFSLTRYLNKPYFEIFENNFNESVFKLLNYIDTINSSSISKQNYEFIDKSDFFIFNAQEIENIELNEKFVIREYRIRDIKFDNISNFNKYHKDKWKVPHLNFKKLDFNVAKVSCIGTVPNDNGWSYELIENDGSLKIILPEKYYSKYIPNFEEITPYLDLSSNGSSEFNDFQGANIFSGTYKECYATLNNSKELYKLELDLLRKREKAEQSGRDNSDLDEERLKRSRWHY
ncbi:hypothetical protein [Winogradskyella psychrotolerans]|uniref:hypothetical protein n=1 Tax=Winogradskyella psychrotolerans TaxID=1344585 RepID=UPI001C073917|nr:hypothetical protein [Winogradskyella psychrotolerans]MBU2929578.1 hypothetical protein [Winogradskyella psychrotolerans]